MRKEFYKSFFRGKKITVMGLGVLGRGIQVTRFLAECGADITATDLKDRRHLKDSVKALTKYKINYVLGRHDTNNFELELDSWQCQGFGDERISPQIAVFTNLMSDHMNYYQKNPKQYLTDKSNIYKFQKEMDIFITDKKLLSTLKDKPMSKVVLTNQATLPSVSLKIIGTHNRQDATYAYEVARALNCQDNILTLES